MSYGQFDVTVIGSGPGGAALAQKLAPTGKRILLLERGDFLPRLMSTALPKIPIDLRRCLRG
jgi:choline dehydrogenase-like flavoprotein